MAALTAAALLSVLSACSVVTPFTKPSVAVPDHWLAPTAAPASAASASASAADSTTKDAAQRFWTAFGSAQLQALLVAGTRDGMDVAVARAKLEQARGAARIAGAAGAPTLSLGVDATRGTFSKGSTTAALQGSFTLDPWGGLDAKAQSGQQAARAAGFDVVTVQRTVLSQIATQYFTVLACDERLRLAQDIARDAESLLGLIQRQAELGAASALEVAQQRNAVQTLLAAVPVLRQQRSAAQTQLAILVGQPPEALALQPESLLDLRIPTVESVAPSDVIDARPEVLAAEARLRAAHFDVGAARAAFLPTLSLTASAGWLINPTSAAWSAAASVLQPLIDGGQREGQLQVDRAHAQELLASYRLVILQTLQQVENALDAVDQLRQQEALDDAAVVSAADALRLSRIRYERGASDLTAVLVAQRTLAQAQDARAQVRLQRLQSAAALYIATGGRGQLAGDPLMDSRTDVGLNLRNMQ